MCARLCIKVLSRVAQVHGDLVGAVGRGFPKGLHLGLPCGVTFAVGGYLWCA
ncbi:hypothetical protein VQ643_14150 [Pseudomonas sp. F1_0610]